MPAPFWWIHQILSDYHASDIVIKSNSHPDMLPNEWYRDNIITSSKKNELLDANLELEQKVTILRGGWEVCNTSSWRTLAWALACPKKENLENKLLKCREVS